MMKGKENLLTSLNATTLEKDLSIYADQDLTFRDHVNKTVTKTNQIT